MVVYYHYKISRSKCNHMYKYNYNTDTNKENKMKNHILNKTNNERKVAWFSS